MIRDPSDNVGSAVRRATSLLAGLGLGIACTTIFAVSALAAYNYTYLLATVPPGGMGNDFQVVYRNYNDSCAFEGGMTRSIYGLADGSWVASTYSWNTCGDAKAHLGPSTGYGYTYVQSKCKNVDSFNRFLHCETSRP